MSRHKSSADWSAVVFPEVLRALGAPLSANAKILDLGCGSGDLVLYLRNAGYQAYGTDFADSVEANLSESGPGSDVFRSIESNPYRIPFDDCTFDVVLSDQVFEHVRNYGETLAELRRVTKPGGICLHAFPPKWRLIESHTFVPFNGVIQSALWLKLWAWLGIRNQFQNGMGWREAASMNAEYLKKHTNYPSKIEIRKYFESQFEEVRFVEDVFWKIGSRRMRPLSLLALRLPSAARLFGAFRGRALFCRRTTA